MIKAPFTEEQVKILNEMQVSGYVHPFTCGRCRDACTQWPLPKEFALRATTEGWVCDDCDYTQNWAHDFMADPEALKSHKWWLGDEND